MPAYLDNNAAVPMRPEAIAAVRAWLGDGSAGFANTGSAHAAGRAARAAVDEARSVVAGVLGAGAGEVVFCSGATEADNAAVFGVMRARPDRRRIVVSAGEHPAVLESAAAAVRHAGAEVTAVGLDGDGRVRLDALAAAVDGRTALVCVQAVNSETGVVQPVGAACRIAHAAGAVVLCDAAQAAGRTGWRFDTGHAGDVWSDPASRADLAAVSSGKTGGPKGAGALLIRRGTAWEPLLYGGSQEGGRRAGTEDVAGIAGFAAALRAAYGDSAADERSRVAGLRDRLERGILRLAGADGGAIIVGAGVTRAPGTCLVRFPGRRGDALLMALDAAGVAASVGTACSSGSLRPSATLLAMGLSESDARSAVRFSVGWAGTEADVDFALAALGGVLSRIPRGSSGRSPGGAASDGAGPAGPASDGAGVDELTAAMLGDSGT